MKIPLVLLAAASAADTGIHEKICGYETTSVILNQKTNNTSKIVNTLKKSDILLNDFS